MACRWTGPRRVLCRDLRQVRRLGRADQGRDPDRRLPWRSRVRRRRRPRLHAVTLAHPEPDYSPRGAPASLPTRATIPRWWSPPPPASPGCSPGSSAASSCAVSGGAERRRSARARARRSRPRRARAASTSHGVCGVARAGREREQQRDRAGPGERRRRSARRPCARHGPVGRRRSPRPAPASVHRDQSRRCWSARACRRPESVSTAATKASTKNAPAAVPRPSRNGSRHRNRKESKIACSLAAP